MKKVIKAAQSETSLDTLFASIQKEMNKIDDVLNNNTQEYWSTGYSFCEEALPIIKNSVENIEKIYDMISGSKNEDGTMNLKATIKNFVHKLAVDDVLSVMDSDEIYQEIFDYVQDMQSEYDAPYDETPTVAKIYKYGQEAIDEYSKKRR